MTKISAIVGLVALTFALNGCGGSSSSSSFGGGGNGAGQLQDYSATLPDGSPMMLETDNFGDGDFEGSFAVAASTGPYAFQTGGFEGSISAGQVNASFQCADGTVFTVTGSASGNGYMLTRSDIPGTVLNFTPVTAPTFTRQQGAGSAHLNVYGTSGTMVIPNTIYSQQSGLTEYRGTWQGVKVTFWSYSNGFASFVIYVNDFALDSLNFASLPYSSLGTATVNSSSGYMNVYSPVTKVILKFASNATISP